MHTDSMYETFFKKSPPKNESGASYLLHLSIVHFMPYIDSLAVSRSAWHGVELCLSFSKFVMEAISNLQLHAVIACLPLNVAYMSVCSMSRCFSKPSQQ